MQAGSFLVISILDGEVLEALFSKFKFFKLRYLSLSILRSSNEIIFLIEVLFLSIFSILEN